MMPRERVGEGMPTNDEACYQTKVWSNSGGTLVGGGRFTAESRSDLAYQHAEISSIKRNELNGTALPA
jgi:hypothetical protein